MTRGGNARTHERLPVAGAAILALCLSVFSCSAWAQADGQPEEHRLKAAFVYKFAGFVDWQSNLSELPTLNIGVLGAPEILNELAQIVPGRTVGDRAITARGVDPADLRDLHILFIGKSEAARLPQLAAALQERGILVVTEWDGALMQGGTINFVIADRRVKFEISLPAAEKSRLKLSSRLLAVAHRVVGAP
jgi:hypothetical protein